jgi:hypothetical protein
MEMQIILIIAVTASVGFCGGIIFAHIFELPQEREDRKRRQARSKKREERRRAANRRMDKMRKITTNFS